MSCLFSVWLSPSQTPAFLFPTLWRSRPMRFLFVSDGERNADRPALLALSRPCYCTQESADCITVCGWRRQESKRIEGGEREGTEERHQNDTELGKITSQGLTNANLDKLPERF